MKQRLTVLGSTGSIGTSTLDVVARHPGRFEIFALSAATQVDLMLAQCAQFNPRFAVMASAPMRASSRKSCARTTWPRACSTKADALGPSPRTPMWMP